MTPIGSNRVWHENLLSQLSWVTGHKDEHCAGVNVSAAADDAGVGAIGTGATVTFTGGGGGGGGGRGAVGSTGLIEGGGTVGTTVGRIGAGGFSNFSIVTPHGEKNKNPTNPTTSNAAMTNNIPNFFAIFYL